MRKISVRITKEGTIIYIPSKDLKVEHAGPRNLKRASHVEPWSELSIAARNVIRSKMLNRFFTDDDWFADLTPLGGGVVGPFSSREDALLAENTWLTERFFTMKETTAY